MRICSFQEFAYRLGDVLEDTPAPSLALVGHQLHAVLPLLLRLHMDGPIDRDGLQLLGALQGKQFVGHIPAYIITYCFLKKNETSSQRYRRSTLFLNNPPKQARVKTKQFTSCPSDGATVDNSSH